MRLTGLVAAALVSASLVGSAAAARLEPLVVGSERLFALSWEAWDRRDQRYVSGEVKSSSGTPCHGCSSWSKPWTPRAR